MTESELDMVIELNNVDAERAARPCRCNCGYRCGGPGRCVLGIIECLQQPEGHFVKDCGHKFTKWEEAPYGGSMVCEVCGLSALSHDMRFGP